MNFVNTFKKSLGLDYRSLAFYRFFMGLIVMSDVLYRLPDLTNFYTDVGIVPRSTFVSEMSMPWSFSLHLANGSFGFALFMFALQFLFGLMLMVGFKSRWAMLGAFVMSVSVHNRNWLVNNGGDDIMRALLFISIFLPLNKCFSLDSALREKKEEIGDTHHSTWVLTFFLQVFVIYYVSYLLKDHPIWRRDFTAVFFSSRLDIFATPFGVWTRNFPLFLKISTIFTIWLEFAGPLLLVFSFVFGRFWWVARSLVILLFWALHLGIIATMWIGVFPYLCLVMWAIFIPGPVWDWILKKYRDQNFGKLSLYYDGECRFCQKGVLILREFFLLPEVEIIKAQDKPDIHRLMEKENSWVIVNEKSERFFHFDAAVELARHSPLLKYLVKFLTLKPVLAMGNVFYKWVANHRGDLSRYSQFILLRPVTKEVRWFRWIWEGAGIFMFVTLLMWNLTTIKRWEIKAPFFQTVTRWLHLYQEWNMFAPFPKMDNVWVEIPAVLGDGTELELLTGDRDIYSVKDQKFVEMVPNEHWRKFYLNLSDRTDYARYYGGFLCRQWNERHIRWIKNTTLRKFEIVVYSQPNLPDGGKGGINRKLSWRHWCFDEDFKRESGQPKKN